MMPQRAACRIVFAAVTDLVQKLRENKTVRRLLDMFAKRPPSKIVNLLEALVGTFKERNIIFHPRPRLAIRSLGKTSLREIKRKPW